MLTALRNKTAGIIMKVILGLIVISFALWGVADVFRMRSSTTLAEVGSTHISIDSFRDRFTRELQQAGSRFGRPLTPADARAVGLDRQVLSELMAEATLEEQARRLKLGVPQSVIADSIMKDANFRGPNNAFDPNRFDQILRANGLSEPRYVALQQRLLLRRQIIDGVVGGVAAPAALTEAVFRHQNERRSTSYVVLPPSDGASIAAPDAGALTAFFEERKGTFQKPEARSLTVLAVTPEALAAKETVTDEEVAARFEQDKAKFGTPERRTIERITFPSIADAKEASDKIKAGATFEEIATARNVAAADLSLGTVSRPEILDKTLADVAFALPQGQVSEPVESQFTTALVRVTSIQPATAADLATVKDSLRADIAAQRAADKILTLHDQIEDDRASGMTVTEIAAKQGLDIRTLDGVDRQGLSGGQPVDLPGKDAVLTEAFQSDVGVENNAVQIAAGGYVWFDVTKVDPARPRTYDEAKNDVLARWKAEEARKQLETRADDALKALRDGSLSLPDFAARESQQVQAADKLDRRGGDVGQAVAAQIFSTPRGGFGLAETSDGGRMLFQVTEIDTPSFDPAGTGGQQLASRVGETIENDLAAQYVLQLQTDLGATVNSQALATAVGAQTEQ